MNQKTPIQDIIVVKDSPYFTTKWHRYIEKYIPYLTTLDNQLHQVDKRQALVHRGNLYGYLKENGVPSELHYVILRLNNMNSPLHFTEERDTLMIPNIHVISDILNSMYPSIDVLEK